MKFISVQTTAEDGRSYGNSLINGNEVLHLAASVVTGTPYLATYITFRGGDRLKVVGSPEAIAARIEEALCESQEQGKR